MKINHLKILILAFVALSFNNKKENIKVFNDPGISQQINSVVAHPVEFNDTIHGDTLFEHFNSSHIPLMYSRKILTDVCLDTTCRPLNIELFWGITGDFLGFELPPGEFLSKTEHVKFTPEEYNKLHQLLCNRQSPLATYSLKELVIKKDTSSKVDAVTSATLTAVLDHIVKGAVYTTYTLWHIVYGPSKRKIEQFTSKNLNVATTLKLLNGSNLNDKIWVLNHFPENMEIKGEIKTKFVEFISGDDIYLTERTLNAINKEMLNTEMQNQLVVLFQNSAFLKQRLILQKLKEAPELSEKVAESISFSLKNANGTLVKYAVELFRTQQIDNQLVSSNIALLLENENRYISNLAFQYLKETHSLDKKAKKRLEKYRKMNR